MRLKICKANVPDVYIDDATKVVLYPDETESACRFLQAEVIKGAVILELSEHCWSYYPDAEKTGIDKYNVEIDKKGQYLMVLEWETK